MSNHNNKSPQNTNSTELENHIEQFQQSLEKHFQNYKTAFLKGINVALESKDIKEFKGKVKHDIREAYPDYAKLEDKYKELGSFLKEHSPTKVLQSTLKAAGHSLAVSVSETLHSHLDLDSKKPNINSLDIKAKKYHQECKSSLEK